MCPVFTRSPIFFLKRTTTLPSPGPFVFTREDVVESKTSEPCGGVVNGRDTTVEGSGLEGRVNDTPTVC